MTRFAKHDFSAGCSLVVVGMTGFVFRCPVCLGFNNDSRGELTRKIRAKNLAQKQLSYFDNIGPFKKGAFKSCRLNCWLPQKRSLTS